ncbi:DUF1772 domain-containing protein [Ornithinimicrobium faecis]|uniref:DUF1772 domain-containing protein n=1 Tax=Ornithinimicrobium faecis TaxID=2934158 RepID=A0ABY4YSV4_9MICO|nr:anthrone oxygenase family protein [Ornithinimicrobium sp. HY1793]USQ79854.1 DUF1772 domain-containing protein [Ornithinimicrobium sp. HY1793]
MNTFWATSPLSLATLIGAALTTGLTAGLLYAFAHAVMPGLGTLGDAEHLRSFQRIDAAIANPWMGLAFGGSPVLTLAALLLHLREGGAVLLWLGAALALILATIAITAAVNLPLNAQIQSAAPSFTDATALRERFERRWVTWNIVRTVTSVGSVLCLSAALLASPTA